MKVFLLATAVVLSTAAAFAAPPRFRPCGDGYLALYGDVYTVPPPVVLVCPPPVVVRPVYPPPYAVIELGGCRGFRRSYRPHCRRW